MKSYPIQMQKLHPLYLHLQTSQKVNIPLIPLHSFLVPLDPIVFESYYEKEPSGDGNGSMCIGGGGVMKK